MARSERDLILNLKERREGHAFVEAARDLEKLSRGADASGDHFDAMSRDAKSLGVEIEKTKNRIHDLNLQFARTGDRSLFGDIRKERSFLRQLESVGKDLADITGIAGVEAGKSFTAGMQGSLSTPILGPVLIAGITTAVAAAAPVIGSAIAGAVTGIAGVGGIAGGIAAAAHDPQVRGAARDFGDAISKEFFASGDAFVRPIVSSLDTLERAFVDLDLGDSFAKVAPYVDDLTRGLAEAAERFMPGFNAALERAGPFIDALADGLSDTGAALGTFLEDVSSSDGAVRGLQSLFGMLNGTIVYTGKLVEGLSDAFDFGVKRMAVLSGALEDIPGPLQRVWQNANDVFESWLADIPEAESGIETLGKAARGTGRGIDFMGDALSDAHRQLLDWKDGEIDAEEALDNLTAGFKANGETLNVHTEKGRANLRNLQDFARGALAAAQAKEVETGSLEKGNKVYEHYRTQLIKALRAAGKTKEEAKRLADAWLGVPKNVGTTVTTRYVTKGKPPVIQGPAGNQTAIFSGGGHITERAHGGPYFAGMPRLTGERGPELDVPEHNGRILSNQQLRAMLATPMASGGNTYNITLNVPPTANLAELGQVTIRAIRAFEQRSGKGWRA